MIDSDKITPVQESKHSKTDVITELPNETPIAVMVITLVRLQGRPTEFTFLGTDS